VHKQQDGGEYREAGSHEALRQNVHAWSEAKGVPMTIARLDNAIILDDLGGKSSDLQRRWI
jgi:hypothetical protein